MGYHRNPGWAWEESAATGIVGLIVAICIFLIGVAITILVLLVTEIVRIYREHSREGTQYSRMLLVALAGFIVLLLFALLLVTDHTTQTLGILIASWGFFSFAVAVEVIDWHANRGRVDPSYDDLSLADVLGEWATEPVQSNGRYAERPVG